MESYCLFCIVIHEVSFYRKLLFFAIGICPGQLSGILSWKAIGNVCFGLLGSLLLSEIVVFGYRDSLLSFLIGKWGAISRNFAPGYQVFDTKNQSWNSLERSSILGNLARFFLVFRVFIGNALVCYRECCFLSENQFCCAVYACNVGIPVVMFVLLALMHMV